jgi:hypothetical protein
MAIKRRLDITILSQGTNQSPRDTHPSVFEALENSFFSYCLGIEILKFGVDLETEFIHWLVVGDGETVACC